MLKPCLSSMFSLWQAGSIDIQVCRFRDAQCHHCGKTGHLRAVCYGQAKESAKKSGTSHSVQQEQEQAVTEDYLLFRLGPQEPPYNVGVDVDGRQVTMEIDTGAAVSLMSAVTFKEIFAQERGAIGLRRLHIVGFLGCCATARSLVGAATTARRAPRNYDNEIVG